LTRKSSIEKGDADAGLAFRAPALIDWA